MKIMKNSHQNQKNTQLIVIPEIEQRPVRQKTGQGLKSQELIKFRMPG